MEEMLDDTLEMEDDEELEEEADAEVDKVLFEITDGKLGAAGSVRTELPVSALVSFTWRNIAHWSDQLSNALQVEQEAEQQEALKTLEQYQQQLKGLLESQ